MRRLVDFVRGIAALLTTLTVLGGLPAGLTELIGWPLPTEMPSVELIQRHLDNGDLPDVFVIKVLALIVWLLWAQFALAVLVEAKAAITGADFSPCPCPAGCATPCGETRYLGHACVSGSPSSPHSDRCLAHTDRVHANTRPR